MNKFILFSFIFAGVVAHGWVETPIQEKPHHFVYKMKTPAQETDKQPELQTFEFSSTAPTYEEAFEKAAQACYRHFRDGKRLTEDRGLDIIDVCANPRSL